MSELRDLTAVFRAIQSSLKDIGEHVAAQDAHGEQLRKSIHDLRNDLATRELFSEEQSKALSQVHTWMGSFSKKQAEISEQVTALQSTFADHRREINGRIRDIESPDEVTRA